MTGGPSIRKFSVGEWQQYRELRLRSLTDSPDAFGSTFAAEAARDDAAWMARLASGVDSERDHPVVAELQTERPLRDLMATARDFVEAILETGHAPGIEWVEGASPGTGECQVCGAELRAGVVLCASCRTPHHEDCWRYTGECSTFACRERRFVRDGRTVRAPERRQTPDEWLQEETDRDRRESGGPERRG